MARYHAVFLSGSCKLFYSIVTILKVNTQTITDLDNKKGHCQPPVVDRHNSFLRLILDSQIN